MTDLVQTEDVTASCDGSLTLLNGDAAQYCKTDKDRLYMHLPDRASNSPHLWKWTNAHTDKTIILR